jgi:hypothetical protein
MPVIEPSASSNVIDFTEPHSEVMPSSDHYRKTGELPGREDRARTEPLAGEEEKRRSGNEGESATPGADAAESHAASTAVEQTEQPREHERARPPRENRWQKRERELRELRAENARLKALQTQPEVRQETREESRAAGEAEAQPQAKAKSRPEPKIDEIDPKTGQPKYKNWAEFDADRRKWDREEAVREAQELMNREHQQRQQSEQERLIEQEVNRRVDAIRQTHADYDQTIQAALAEQDAFNRPVFFYTKGSHLDGFFLDSERGHEVMYHLAKHPEVMRSIFARDQQGRYLMNPVRQIRELTKIEAGLPAPGRRAQRPTVEESGEEEDLPAEIPSTVRPISAAPRPPHQTSGKGTVGKDGIAEAVANGDSETYMREQNARALARRKKGIS